ncbi:CorA metal ion transporter [Ceratocystis pirilliformis]|uniref:CorA metal ion transporter n=1 Tax=Ceratocystis pirilliformis TaxID=259994 RepID=A0ABR3Z4L2_9PEZI
MSSKAPATSSASNAASLSSSRSRSRSRSHNNSHKISRTHNSVYTPGGQLVSGYPHITLPQDLSVSSAVNPSCSPQPSSSVVPTSVLASASASVPTLMGSSSKRRKNRGGRKKRTRRKSFAVPVEESHDEGAGSGVEVNQVREWAEEDDDMEREESVFTALPRRHTSGDVIQPDTSFDHRDQKSSRPRRPSMTLPNTSFAPPFTFQRNRSSRQDDSDSDDGKNDSFDEGVPLLSSSRSKRGAAPIAVTNYGIGQSISRRSSTPSLRNRLNSHLTPNVERKNNVNYPPSIPGSPTLGPSDGPDMTFGDVMIRHELSRHASDDSSQRNHGLSDVDDDNLGHSPRSTSTSKRGPMSSTGMGFSISVDENNRDDNEDPRSQVFGSCQRERRRRRWPDLSVLQEWSTYEKESRTEGLRAKKITEPQLINGRLRPVNKDWYLSAEELPYRFTYFNEELPSTIHSQTISELVQSDGSFRELFLPDRRVLSDDSDSSSSEDERVSFNAHMRGATNNQNPLSKTPSRNLGRGSSTLLGSGFGCEIQREMSSFPDTPLSNSLNGRDIPGNISLPASPPSATVTPIQEKTPRLGDRPVWWLDIMNPTEAELKVIAKAFGIHPLTAEDIMLQEAREKVELFRHYYFVNYRTFDQDVNSGEYLEPVNMYVVVFREGVLSFHFSMTPHAANVRRRVRQLRDYLIVSSDWISYAIIDDITDAFVPLIQSIEDEVDDIDDVILKMHNTGGNTTSNLFGANKKTSDASSMHSGSSASTAESNGDMLRRVGDCRKRVILLYRLLGNKADVIKGFAKRCNERWEVAPRSEIGLYLGDIQDHIVTMTANLSHYERMLSRSHANYLAQINIEMSERQEKTADVLGKLTVLGTIVLPMNIITGLWGMNVWVPGQGTDNDLTWFMWISTGLLMFGGACYLIAKRVYGIV